MKLLAKIALNSKQRCVEALSNHNKLAFQSPKFGKSKLPCSIYEGTKQQNRQPNTNHLHSKLTVIPFDSAITLKEMNQNEFLY